MFKNKKVIIFDMDGTLIDSSGVWDDADRAVCKKLLGDDKADTSDAPNVRNKILANCKTNDIYIEYCQFLKEKYNSDLSANEILQLRHDIVDVKIINNVEYKQDADKVLKYLKENGYKLVIASITTNREIEMYKNQNQNIIQKADFKEIFDLILTKDDVDRVKPDPDIYNKIMEKLGVTPNDCFIFEDSLTGILAAKNAGIDVAAIYDIHQEENREKINEQSNYQFDNWKEVLKIIEKELEVKELEL